jgi:NitT/TauT family transport system substrate-binding protein
MSRLDKRDTVTRRDFIRQVSAGALVTTALSPFIFSPSCKKGTEVRVGYLPITDAAPLLTAWSGNFFKDEGLRVPRPTMIRNWSSLVEAFLAEKVDVVHLLLPIPIWMRFNRGYPVKVVAWDHTNGSALTVPRNSPIRNFADLGGSRIAVPYWYSMHNVIIQMGITKFGLTPIIRSGLSKPSDNEVELIVLPPPEMPVAMASGKIDGYIVAEPFNALAEIKSGARILRFTGDIWKNHPCCVVVMKDAFMKEKPLVTRKVINAIVRAQSWLRNNRSAAALQLGRGGSGLLPVESSVLDRVFNGYHPEEYNRDGFQAIKNVQWKSSRIDFQPYPYPSATWFILENLRKTIVEGSTAFLEGITSLQAAKELVDNTVVRKSIRDLGLENSFATNENIDSPWQREEVLEW